MEDALRVTPNMTEPPFGDIDARIRNISIALGVVSSHHGTSSLRPFQYPPSSYSPRLTMHCRLRPPLHCHLSASLSNGQLSPPTPRSSIRASSSWNKVFCQNCYRYSDSSLMIVGMVHQSRICCLSPWCSTGHVDAPLTALLCMRVGYILPDALTRKIGIEAVVECLHKSMMVYIGLNNNRTILWPLLVSFTLCLSVCLCVSVSVCVVELGLSFSMSCLCRWYVTLPAVAAGHVATSSSDRSGKWPPATTQVSFDVFRRVGASNLILGGPTCPASERGEGETRLSMPQLLRTLIEIVCR
jgi:hypothetical protein